MTALPRNVWATSVASFLTDVSSEMLFHLLPLFLANVLGVKTAVIGLIEGVAATTSSLVELAAGRLSDRVGRKWLTVAGYSLSLLAKPVFAVATTWSTVAGARFAERAGKGVRTAPRDALLADSIGPGQRGLAFGFHRAADTGGAVVGIAIAMSLVWQLQGGNLALEHGVFQTLVWISLVPAALGVLCLAVFVREVRRRSAAADSGPPPRLGLRGLGRPFAIFLAIVAVFELGNSADAFLVLRAQERGTPVLGILGALLAMNAVYALVAVPAGRLSDKVGRRPLLAAAWAVYAGVYLGFALAEGPWHTAGLYILYGAYYGLGFGTAKALVADLVPAELRGTAYGTYHATLGIMDLPASLLAGVLWQGLGGFAGFGPAAPFVLGAGLAGLAAAALALWRPERADSDSGAAPGGAGSTMPGHER